MRFPAPSSTPTRTTTGPQAVYALGPRWLQRLGRLRWSPRADVALAGVCCALGQLEVAVIGPDLVRMLSAALATLPIAWRQRAPLAASAVFAASWAIWHLWSGVIGVPFFMLAGLPVIYSLGAHQRLGRALAGAGTMLVALSATDIRSLYFFAFQFVLLWGSGRGVRTYRLQSERLRALATRLEGEREISERLAVAEERQRIASELHDTIAHAVSLMFSKPAAPNRCWVTSPTVFAPP
jgi:signal transduction histidine kinase